MKIKKTLKSISILSTVSLPLVSFSLTSCSGDKFPEIPFQFMEFRALEIDNTEDLIVREYINSNNIKDFFSFLAEK
jgi:hypothetical protein